MWVRAVSGLVFLLIVVSAIIYSNYTLALLFLIIIWGASFELSKLFNAYYKTNINSFSIAITPVLIYLFLTLLMLDLIDRNYEAIFITTLILLFLIPLHLSLFFFKESILTYICATYFSIIYIVLPFTFLTLNSKFGKHIDDYDYTYFLSFFILIWVNDTFAYLSGKLLGKRKLWESISPNKTIEGFAGGLIFTIFAGYVLRQIGWVEINSNLKTIIIGLFVSLAATVGDLFESKLKRLANVKDSGAIMPGHGGFLDRFDGVLFAAPLYVVCTLFI